MSEQMVVTYEMWNALTKRVAELEALTMGLRRLGPREPTALDRAQARRVKKIITSIKERRDLEPPKEMPPVDRSARVLVSGDPVPEDESHRHLKENGQQQDYVVLSATERAKGFVRPYRDAYRHLKCGKITTMSRSIAETYARDPGFYSGTFCTHCGVHLPIGEEGEFVWYEMDGTTGPKVGL
jgi:hypothetical protein